MKVNRASTRRWDAALLVGMGILVLLGIGMPPMRAAAKEPPPRTKSDGDLLTPPEEKPIRGVTRPSLSPDGKTLCFTYLGDLWTVPTSGGTATRLTVHEALDTGSRWSPDGRWIAFTSLRTGNSDVFIVPAEGGSARQVTFWGGADGVSDWSPDGSKLLFLSARDTENFALYSIDLHTRAIKRMTSDVEALSYGNWSQDGKTLAYTRGGQPWSRPWYRGSGAASIVLQDIASGNVRTLLKTNAQQFWPFLTPDGKYVYMSTLYGNSNTPNLWRVPVAGGEPKAITHYTTDAVRYPYMARNGALLTYTYQGDVYTVKPDGSDAKRVTIIARSDDKVNNQEREVLSSGLESLELSPDGKQLALVLHGNIWVVPVAGGEAKRLTDDTANNNDIAWSPDGSKLVMISDRGNQVDLYTLDVKTKALTRLTNDSEVESDTHFSPDGKWISFVKSGPQSGLYIAPSAGGSPPRRLAEGNGNNEYSIGIPSHAWSPDSRWVAFSRTDRFMNRDIWVVPTVGGTAVNVTRYPATNRDPAFTRDGRRLLFLSTRNGTQQLFQLPLETPDDSPSDENAPRRRPDRSQDVKIDFEDIHLRARPIIAGVDDFTPTPDSQRVVIHGFSGFAIVPMSGGGVQVIAPGEAGGHIEFTPDGSRFYYYGANGSARSLGMGGGPPATVSFTAEMIFDRRLQYHQAFNEFYRRYGSGFYDSKMHGADWKALHDKYEPLLQGVGTAEEFAFLLSMMVGEVNASHSEINPPIKGGGPQPSTLGVYYDNDYAGPGLKVSSVLPKGPADRAATRLNAGDYILSVDGTDVSLNEDYYRLLQDRAGKTVELVVNTKPSKDGARTVRIKPIPPSTWSALAEDARVRHDREMVDKLSGGRLAYIYIKVMDEASLQKFQRELWSEAVDKQGLVLDIRGNIGGNTHDAILETLSRHIYAYLQPRDALRQSQPQQAWTKPIVLLIDQTSYSDAEVFPAGFRALQLGKIVGVPTPGYVIGVHDEKLIDGTSFRVPAVGFYTAEGKNMENLGIVPDITVENTPEDIRAHHDRQLEVAVETLLKETSASASAASTGSSLPAVPSSK
jgi:tricorn protease